MAMLLLPVVLSRSASTPLAVLLSPVVLLKEGIESAGGVEATRCPKERTGLQWRYCCRPWCCAGIQSAGVSEVADVTSVVILLAVLKLPGIVIGCRLLAVLNSPMVLLKERIDSV